MKMRKFFALIMLALFTSVGMLSASTGVYDADIGKHVKDVVVKKAVVDVQDVILENNFESFERNIFNVYHKSETKTTELTVIFYATEKPDRQCITLNYIRQNRSVNNFISYNKSYPVNTLSLRISPCWCSTLKA